MIKQTTERYIMKNKQAGWLFLISLSLGISEAGVPEPPPMPASMAAPAYQPQAPEIGTDIRDLVKPEMLVAKQAGMSILTWDDLTPKEFQSTAIMAKYKAELDAIQEGAPEEKALLDKVMAEFNAAPPNADLDGKTVKLMGFVSPLDVQDGKVKEFLLVPYFGSCIHSPPPPINQTVLVKLQAGQSIPMDQIARPVWAVGSMKVGRQETDLASAGYSIENAQTEAFIQQFQAQPARILP